MATKTKCVHLLLLLLASFHDRIGYAAFTPNQEGNPGENDQSSGDQTIPDQGGNTDLNNPGNEGQNPGQQTNPNTRADLPGDCGTRKSNGIIGAEMTVFGEFPWIAIIEYLDNGKTLRTGCGGVLITQRYVLTAAQCVKEISSTWQVQSVRLREHNMTDPDEPFISVPCESTIVHEEYNKPAPFRNDIALIRLARDVKITPYVRPICLPSSVNDRQTYTSAGWGLTKARRNSDVMLKGPLKLYDFEQCAEKYATQRVPLGLGQMCAGGNVEKDTCQGDLGGPLMTIVVQNGKPRWVVEGIASIGPPCIARYWPRVYTKVIDYMPWIEKNLRR